MFKAPRPRTNQTLVASTKFSTPKNPEKGVVVVMKNISNK